MNVMTRHSTPDSASMRNARSTLQIAGRRSRSRRRRAGRPARASGSAREEGVERDHARRRRSPARRRVNTVSRIHLRPNKIRNAAPRKGSSGMRRKVEGHRWRRLRQRFIKRGFVEVDGLAAAEQADQDRQPDRGLGRRQGDHEEGEHVPLLVAERAREREQRQVAGVELQLDAHQHDEGVAPQQHAGGPDQEQDEGQDQVVGGRHGSGVLRRGARAASAVAPASAGSRGSPARGPACGSRRRAFAATSFWCRARHDDAAHDRDQQQQRDRLERDTGSRGTASRRRRRPCRRSRAARRGTAAGATPDGDDARRTRPAGRRRPTTPSSAHRLQRQRTRPPRGSGS